MRPSPRSLRHLALTLALGVGVLTLGACGAQSSGNGAGDGAAPVTGTAPPPPERAPASDAQGRPLIEQPLSSAPVVATDAGAPGEVDYACTTDADCAVKDVGNCCGYYPACVNKDSPTFPEQVKAECAKNDMMATCGFAEIEGCQCVENRCVAGPASSGETVR